LKWYRCEAILADGSLLQAVESTIGPLL